MSMFDKDDYIELFKIVLVGIVALFMIMLSVLIPFYFLDKRSCGRMANVMGLESRYEFLTGCMIKIDDKFQPLDKYQNININQ